MWGLCAHLHSEIRAWECRSKWTLAPTRHNNHELRGVNDDYTANLALTELDFTLKPMDPQGGMAGMHRTEHSCPRAAPISLPCCIEKLMPDCWLTCD